MCRHDRAWNNPVRNTFGTGRINFLEKKEEPAYRVTAGI
jgi:hypothetical protein